MYISDDLHTMFKARREAFEIMYGQPTYANLQQIVEELAKLIAY